MKYNLSTTLVMSSCWLALLLALSVSSSNVHCRIHLLTLLTQNHYVQHTHPSAPLLFSGLLSQPWPSATLINAFPSPQHHFRDLSTIPKPTSSIPKPYTRSQPCLITPNPIRLNPISCTYLLLALVPCLSLPLIHYLYLSLVPSVWHSEFSISVNPIPPNPHYILCSSPYIWSPIHNLSRYVSLSACSISSRTLVSSSSVW